MKLLLDAGTVGNRPGLVAPATRTAAAALE
jgi:hypothetical protein